MKNFVLYATLSAGLLPGIHGEFNCDNPTITLPFYQTEYKHCTTIDNNVNIKPQHDGDKEVRIEGFTTLSGQVGYGGQFGIRSIWCDAHTIGHLFISAAPDVESITLPNATSIDSITVENAENLKQIHAPQLRSISRSLLLFNVPKLIDFNVSKASPGDGEGFAIGHVPSETLHQRRPLRDTSDRVGEVSLSNVSQEVVDTLLGDPLTALPDFKLENSPAVHHVNVSVGKVTNFTLSGTGDTTLTFSGHDEQSGKIYALGISGVKQINMNRQGSPLLWVNEVRIVDNPSLKEAPLLFHILDVVNVTNNPLLESIRFPAASQSDVNYSTYVIANNPKLHLSAATHVRPREEDTYRTSDDSYGSFQWFLFRFSKLLHLEGNFDMDFFSKLNGDHDGYADELNGSVFINSTAPGFSCSKLNAFKHRSTDTAPGAFFTCNGETSLRSKSAASSVSAQHSLPIALLCGLWFML